jgi:DNA repair exonuclease SbcCD ATPase subunit
MIRYEKIKWKNFLSTGNDFIEIDLSKNGSTLICGENGSGKSTLLDAITYSLFGKPFRNINKPQLVNTINNKNMVVEIEFSTSNSSYKIVRGMKPSIFEIYINDKLLNQSSDVRDYQEILEKQIIKTSYKTFCQVDILGSASFIPFMQLPAAQRRSFIEDLLDLQIFTTMNSLLKENIQENTKNIIESEAGIKSTRDKIKFVKNHLKEMTLNNDSWINQKNKEIEQLDDKLYISQDNTTNLSKQLLKLEEAYASLGISDIENKIKKLNEYKSQFNTRIDLHKKDVKFLSDNDICPTCKQTIDQIFKCDTINEKTSEINSLEQANFKIIQTSNELQEKINLSFDIKNKIVDVRNMLSSEKLSIDHMIRLKKHINEEINRVKTTSYNNSDDKIVDLEKELNERIKSYNLLQEERNVLNISAIILKDGGIKTSIINQYIPIINKLIAKYLALLEFHVQFELNNQFEETIKSRYRDVFSYASFSEGEKQKIDLALLFAWRSVSVIRNSMNANILIMDEIFDSSLDSTSAEQLMSIVQNLSETNSLFIISHKEQMIDRFSNVIKFVKNKNFSKMLVE